MEGTNIVVSAAPHVRSNESIAKIMKMVSISLLPAGVAGIYFFGLPALIRIIVTCLCCVGSEYLFQKCTKQPVTIDDYSSLVTGLLLAYNLPMAVPLWICAVGSVFAIILVKQLFGGLGQNFMNPALAARAFLLASYPVAMTTWVISGSAWVDAVTGPTPLGLLKETDFAPAASDIMNAFIGNIGGCIGETSALALLIGGAYLLYKKVITWRIPVTFIGTVFLLSYCFGRNGLYEIMIGGVMIGAIFMATDYSSSPITPIGQLIMGVSCGCLTVLIRNLGSYPEGVSYSILILNLCVPLIDRYTEPKIFGKEKRA